MATRTHPKRGLFVDGLSFAPGPIFSSQTRANRFYGLLLGPDYYRYAQTLEQQRSRATGILSAIFKICVSRVPTFVALKDNKVGWQIVAGDIREQHNAVIEPDEVEELVRVFAAARARFIEGEQPTRGTASTTTGSSELKNLIDEWLDKTGRDHPIPSQAQSTPLVARPAPIGNLMAGFSLLGQGSSSPAVGPAAVANTGQPWPPSHLAATDYQFLTHPRVQAHLAGVSWGNKEKMPDLVGEKTDPLGLRVWLGWLAAANTPRPPNNTLALYVAPVAFFTNKERQGWYEDSGRQSKMFGHVEGFLDYAVKAFQGGKKMVLGLLTPFFPTAGEARTYAKTTGKSALEVFDKHDKMRRFGIAIMLRVVERNGAKGIQVALFCPWDNHSWIKDSWKRREWRMLLWKQKLVDTVTSWAAKNKITIHEGYAGGSIMVRKGRKDDSVEMCAGWLLRAVTATNKTIPGNHEEDDWEWEELCYFKKLSNWMPMEEEEDNQMDVDTDM